MKVRLICIATLLTLALSTYVVGQEKSVFSVIGKDGERSLVTIGTIGDGTVEIVHGPAVYPATKGGKPPGETSTLVLSLTGKTGWKVEKVQIDNQKPRIIKRTLRSVFYQVEVARPKTRIRVTFKQAEMPEFLIPTQGLRVNGTSGREFDDRLTRLARGTYLLYRLDGSGPGRGVYPAAVLKRFKLTVRASGSWTLEELN